jgi:hypothetical protein
MIRTRNIISIHPHPEHVYTFSLGNALFFKLIIIIILGGEGGKEISHCRPETFNFNLI